MNDEFRAKLGLDKKALDELVENAHQEISSLCKGKRWTMCIPVQADDSDIVLSEALLEQTKEIKRLREALEVIGRGVVNDGWIQVAPQFIHNAL